MALDKTRLDGIARQLAGSFKQAIGRITGATRTEAEGASQKARGEVQAATGVAQPTERSRRDA